MTRNLTPLLFILLWATPALAANPEQRCQDLGPHCVCAESLNVNQTCPAGSFCNPTNSTTKQCNNLWPSNSYPIQAVSPTGLPPGINWIWESHNINNDQGPVYPGVELTKVPAGTKRVAIRSYQQFSSNFTTPDWPDNDSIGCERGKLIELNACASPSNCGSGSLQQFQSEQKTDGGIHAQFTYAGSSGAMVPQPGSDTIQLNVDCAPPWICRFEMALGAVSGDLASGGTWVPEYWVDSTNGKSAHWKKSPETYNASGRACCSDLRLVNGFRQGNTCAGDRRVSHLLHARWDTNEGQRIGAALEVEPPDYDSDGHPNNVDNCVQHPNPSQLDTNSDGYGNACDADWDNDGEVGGIDYLVYSATNQKCAGDEGYNPEVDADEDDCVGGVEYLLWRSQFEGEPGPSGYGCAGTVPCP